MPKKAELLEKHTKADLLKMAEKAGVDQVKKSMNKSELVETLARTTKIKKADLQ